MPRANGITRQEILTSIKRQGSMTAEELAGELGISQVAVRQHLAALEAESIIRVSVERRGLGRPAHRYMLTPHGDETFPRRYDTLANTLLDELRTWQGQEALTYLLQKRRERLWASIASQIGDKPLPNKVNELARILTEQGFMAEAVDLGGAAFELIKRNCPLLAVARNHPALCCREEAPLLKSVLGDVEVSQERSILDGDHACAFCIRAYAHSAE